MSRPVMLSFRLFILNFYSSQSSSDYVIHLLFSHQRVSEEMSGRSWRRYQLEIFILQSLNVLSYFVEKQHSIQRASLQVVSFQNEISLQFTHFSLDYGFCYRILLIELFFISSIFIKNSTFLEFLGSQKGVPKLFSIQGILLIAQKIRLYHLSPIADKSWIYHFLIFFRNQGTKCS